MMRALWTAGTGMVAQQGNIDNISNNLANVNTTGFKKTRLDFQDLMYQTIRQAGAASGQDTQIPTGLQMGHGVRQVATQKIYTQGNFQATGNSLDVAIEGDGFFQITMPDGTIAYTRDGAFKKDSQGRMCTSDGFLLEPQITIPQEATDFTVSSEGRVTATTTAGQQDLGEITLARFINPSGLESIGRNLLKETEASGVPMVTNPGADGAGTLAQKYLEMSNVQVVDEMVNMIVAQRAYETNSKAITTADEMLGQAANLKR
ncbi:flagellar basal-body rod protein FlgG [Anaerospora hongkongensis]|uniref:Flagellar basal-body rod protein FlgG n=3 Tax=Anaerospora hongkongensis TaxID=244830 RepID=A0A4R1PNM5_9FIRM|nr:flagellar basal-body rod protein FlgG [Anaerospora hongkongensis]TCL32969.1 flagellar basal-body rod protein FlgG [Anaerospora hongkongensis]